MDRLRYNSISNIMIKKELSSHSPSERWCQYSSCFENGLTPALRREYTAKRLNRRQRHTQASTVPTTKINVSDFLTINNSLQNSIVKGLSQNDGLASAKNSQYTNYYGNDKVAKLRRRVVKPFYELDINKREFVEDVNAFDRKGNSAYTLPNQILTPVRISRNSFLQNYKSRIKISQRKACKRGKQDGSLIYLLSKIAVQDPSLSRCTKKLKCK